MCIDKVIAFRAETCEGCGCIYNGYNHKAAIEHISCLQRLHQTRMVNDQIDNPEKWRLLREKFASISFAGWLHPRDAE